MRASQPKLAVVSFSQALVLASIVLLLCTPQLSCSAAALTSRRRRHRNTGGREELLKLRPELEAAIAAVAVNNTVLVSEATCGYLEFAVNWVHHLTKLGFQNYLLIAEDQVSLQFLQAQMPGHVVSAEEISGRPLPPGGSDAINLAVGGAEFGALLCSRQLYLQALISLGYNILHLDLDTVFIRDPLPYIPTLYEYVGTDDSRKGQAEQDTPEACGCFLYFRPTARVRLLLRRWQQLCVPGTPNDQPVLNDALRLPEMRDLQKFIMPRQLFPNGWDFRHRPQDCEFWRSPVWAHVNWLNDADEKRAALHEQGLWFESQLRFPLCTPVPNEE